MKPYYEDDSVTIYHGDCREVLAELPDQSSHLCLMDPPYFRVVEHDWDNQWGPDVAKFLAWLGEVVGECQPPLADRGTLAVFCSPDMSAGVELEVRRRMNVLNHVVWRKPSPGWLGQSMDNLRRFFPLSERIIIAEKERNPDGDLFRFRDTVNHAVARETWADLRQRLVALRDAAGLTNRDIDTALGKNGMAGHYFGASQWALPTAEAWDTISHMMRERGVKPPPFEELRREFDSRRREFDSRRQGWELLSDVWTFEPVLGNNRSGHPTEKPKPLIAHMVQTMSRGGDLVLDPFMGSGTTLRAAKDLGRKAIGIEIEERYCEIAARRLSQEVLPL